MATPSTRFTYVYMYNAQRQKCPWYSKNVFKIGHENQNELQKTSPDENVTQEVSVKLVYSSQ